MSPFCPLFHPPCALTNGRASRLLRGYVRRPLYGSLPLCVLFCCTGVVGGWRDSKTNRDRVTRCLASFARDSVLAGSSGVPYIFLHFPEGDTLNQESLARSLEFARREASRLSTDPLGQELLWGGMVQGRGALYLAALTYLVLGFWGRTAGTARTNRELTGESYRDPFC